MWALDDPENLGDQHVAIVQVDGKDTLIPAPEHREGHRRCFTNKTGWFYEELPKRIPAESI